MNDQIDNCTNMIKNITIMPGHDLRETVSKSLHDQKNNTHRNTTECHSDLNPPDETSDIYIPYDMGDSSQNAHESHKDASGISNRRLFSISSRDGKDHHVLNIQNTLNGYLRDGDFILSVDGLEVTKCSHTAIVSHFNDIIKKCFNVKLTMVILIKRTTNINTELFEFTFELNIEDDIVQDGIQETIAFHLKLIKRIRKYQYTKYSTNKVKIGSKFDKFIKYDSEKGKLIMDVIDSDSNPQFLFTKHQFFVQGDKGWRYVCALQPNSEQTYLCCSDFCCELQCSEMGPINTNGDCLELDKRFFYYINKDDYTFFNSSGHEDLFIAYNIVDGLFLKKAVEPWSADFARKNKASEFQFNMYCI